MSFFESDTEIQKDLQTIGVEIDFSTYSIDFYCVDAYFPFNSIKAIPGFSTVRLQDVSSFRSVIEEQDFNFYASMRDIITHKLAADLMFRMTDTINNYYFLIMQKPVPSMDGWARIACNLVKIEVLL
ncbi:MAG: hypothetical protein NTV98_05990 [Candidatus Roizmanbacteria bacterium]|nr:hypothetical protein [Candidatus Roizmanbacteria bacterium]